MSKPSTNILLWNANGILQRWHELNQFLSENGIEIALVSETHLLPQQHLRKFPGYAMYSCHHPSGNARGGSLVLVKNHIKHTDLGTYSTSGLQASVISVTLRNVKVNVGALYCPPNSRLDCKEFCALFSTLGDCWLLGGDFNAKHPLWGSRLTTPRGRQLFTAIHQFKGKVIAPSEPTHWPIDNSKQPDIIDFFVSRNFSSSYTKIECISDLSSDHLPLVLQVNSTFNKAKFEPQLTNKSTNWSKFREIVDSELQLNKEIIFPFQLDAAVSKLTTTLSNAAMSSTRLPELAPKMYAFPTEIKQLVQQRRSLRRKWQRTRNSADRSAFNRMASRVKAAIAEFNNKSFEDYLASLTAACDSDYSLWRATKRLGRQPTTNPPLKNDKGDWVRDDMTKCRMFAEYLESQFKPNDIVSDLDPAMIPSGGLGKILPTSPMEVAGELDKLNAKKSPGPDRIGAHILKNLSKRGIVFLTKLINTSFRLKYVPKEWKLANVIMLPKPGKPMENVSSYRPISLLSTVSKVFEKILQARLKKIIAEKNILPDIQYGFREKHSTVEQVHRLTHHISQSIENGEFCPTVFLDISSAFDRVWHDGLISKLSKIIPPAYCELIKDYLSDRSFRVKVGTDFSRYHPILAGVPQGSVLGPTLYLLYTYDIPQDSNVTITLFADDTAISARHKNYTKAATLVQKSLDRVYKWTRRWKIAVNEGKSAHIIFTLRHFTNTSATWGQQIIPMANAVRYLGLHLDNKLNWAEHVRQKRDFLNIKFRKYYWLMGRHSKLSLENKRLIYLTVFKPVWTYGLPVWGTTKDCHREVIQRFQNKVLRTITGAPFYVSNAQLHNDLCIDTIEQTYKLHIERYIRRLHNHPNITAIQLLDDSDDVRRLNRRHFFDLN